MTNRSLTPTPLRSVIPGCHCYVSRLPAGRRFGVRFGAHEPSCPAYRPSLDPCDRAADERFRSQFVRGHWADADEPTLPARSPSRTLDALWRWRDEYSDRLDREALDELDTIIEELVSVELAR